MLLFAFSGSSRPGSAVGQLLRAAAAPAGVDAVMCEGVLTLPLFSPDLDGPGAPVPAASFAVPFVRGKLDAAGALPDEGLAARLAAAVATLVAAVAVTVTRIKLAVARCSLICKLLTIS